MTPPSNKPLTFAAMLVRAQRRFDAMGRPFPAARNLMPVPKQPLVKDWPAWQTPAAAGVESASSASGGGGAGL